LNKKLSCPRAKGIPLGKVGIHYGAKKEVFGFPLSRE